MQQLVEFLVKALLDHPERVTVTEQEGDRSILYQVRVAGQELGKVIGKGGRIANALRTVVRAAGSHQSKSVWIDLDRLPGDESTPEEQVEGG